MKFCQPHWDRLRVEIEIRGMGHLVAGSGAAAAQRLRDEAEGKATDATFDPLMAAHHMVAGRMLELGQMYLMTGDYCPVCEAIKGHAPHMSTEEVERHYLDGPADAVLLYCREGGLVT